MHRLVNHPIVDKRGVPLDEPVQYYPIDGFIVSSNMAINFLPAQDLAFVAGAHNPVVMQLTLN